MSSVEEAPVRTGKYNDRPLTIATEENTVDFIGADGQVHKLVDMDNAKIVAKKLMKKFNPDNHIALKINRQHIKGKDYFYALIVRKFSETDISEQPKDYLWIGRVEIMNPRMKQDTREYSETLGERVPVTEEIQYPDGKKRAIPVIGNIGYYYYHEVNKDTILLYKQLYGMFPNGRETELIWQLNNASKPSMCKDPAEFWEVDIKTVEEAIRSRQRKRVTDNEDEE